jgi:hypothetical protein
VVPKPQNSKPLLLQKRVPAYILFIVGVLGAVSFDDQPFREAGEINDVWKDDLLPLELVGGESPIAKHRPESLFGLCRMCPHPLRTCEQLFSRDEQPLTLPSSLRCLGPSLSRKGRGAGMALSHP